MFPRCLLGGIKCALVLPNSTLSPYFPTLRQVSSLICLTPFLYSSRVLFVPLQMRSGWPECRTSSSSCPLLTTGQCCPQPAELSPAALQRALVPFQALSHAATRCLCVLKRLKATRGEFIGSVPGHGGTLGAADGCGCAVLGLGAAAWHLVKLDLLGLQ